MHRHCPLCFLTRRSSNDLENPIYERFMWCLIEKTCKIPKSFLQRQRSTDSFENSIMKVKERYKYSSVIERQAISHGGACKLLDVPSHALSDFSGSFQFEYL